jgi:hypothetical protein
MKTKLGDSVSFRGKKTKNHKTEVYLKGFVTENFIEKSMWHGGYVWVKDYSECKTTFSFRVGGGTKRFNKDKDLNFSAVLLVEKNISNIFDIKRA